MKIKYSVDTKGLTPEQFHEVVHAVHKHEGVPNTSTLASWRKKELMDVYSDYLRRNELRYVYRIDISERGDVYWGADKPTKKLIPYGEFLDEYCEEVVL